MQPLHYTSPYGHPPSRAELEDRGLCHGVPHFHIEGPGFRASVAIATLEVIVGSVPRRVLVAALAWALAHQSELQAKWEELNP